MGRFRFRLAAALRERERVRDEKRRALLTLEGARAQLVHEIESLADLFGRQQEELSARAGAGVEGSEIRLEGEWGERLADRIAERSRLLRALEENLAEARADLERVHREVKSLERLRERAWQEYRRFERRREQKLTDERAGQAYQRKK